MPAAERTAARPVDPERAAPAGAHGDRRTRQLRRLLHRPGHQRVRGRTLQLVRAPVAAPLLEERVGHRQGGRLPHAVRVPGHRGARCSRPTCPSWPRSCTGTWWANAMRANPSRCTSATGRRPTRRSSTRTCRSAWAARKVVNLGRAARKAAQLKIRQPLATAVIACDARERAAVESLADVVTEELNVKELEFVDSATDLVSFSGQAQLPDAGPAVRQEHARGGGGRGGAADGPTWPRASPPVKPSASGGRTRPRAVAEDLLVETSQREGFAVEQEADWSSASPPSSRPSWPARVWPGSWCTTCRTSARRPACRSRIASGCDLTARTRSSPWWPSIASG